MCHPNRLWVLTLSALLVLPSISAFGQVRGGGARRARIGGGSPVRSTPRGGWGVRSNPVVNPAPSLTPSQVLNPRGSLNTGQVLNPKPSINRPRTGVTAPSASDTVSSVRNRSGAAIHQAGQTSSHDGPTDTSDPAQASTRHPNSQPIGTQLLESVVALDAKINEMAPEKGWSKRLSLDALRGVPVFSEKPSDDDTRKQLTEIVKAYQGIAKDDNNSAITELPEFKRTLTLMQEYLTPLDTRRRRDLQLALDQLHVQLSKYKNGAPWAEYLSLPDNLESDAMDAQITKLLSRFDKLDADKTYAKVTRLPGFRPAYAALKALAELSEQRTPDPQ